MMRTRRGWMGALVGALALWTAPALAQVVTIAIDNGVMPVDGVASVNVTQTANGANVGGMQADIIFDNTIVNLATKSDCKINSAIGLFPGGDSCLDDSNIGPCKNLSSVLNVCGGSPQAEGCPDGAGDNISVYRGIIAATAAPNNNAIPDGVLITCSFQVVGTLPAALIASNVVVSDPTGTRLESEGVDGSIVGDGPVDTPTPEPTTPPVDGVLIQIGSDPGTGATASIDVTLAGDNMDVGGMQNDIVFDNTLVNLATKSDCKINSAIGLFPGGDSCLDDSSIGPCKNLSSVLNVCGGSPQAEGCPDGAGDNISVFRGIIAATAAPNNNTIPDGVLYNCLFQIVNSAGLPALLDGTNQVVSDPFGTRLESNITDGVIGAGDVPTATPTVEAPPTETPTEIIVVPTNTPVPVEPTNTQAPTETATPDDSGEVSSFLANGASAADVAITLVNGDGFPTGGGTVLVGDTTVGYTERVGNQLFLTQALGKAYPAGTLVTLLRGGGDDDDGCHINAKATNSNAWLLLVPALGLLALRRKQW